MINEILKNLYYIFFSVYKYLKYPTCKIKTGHIHPAARLGKYVVIGRYCRVDRNVCIGDFTFINEYVRIDANTKSIGKYCSISHNVKIGLGPHPINFVSTSPVFYSKSRSFVKNEIFDEYCDKGFTTIGHDVLIGANAIILAGVKVGTGAIIGAGSIVAKDVEPYAIVAGSPAKKIRYRFDEETIGRLLNTEWWSAEPDYLLSQFNMTDVEAFLCRFEEVDSSKKPST